MSVLEIEDSDVIVVSRKDIPHVVTCDQCTQTGTSSYETGVISIVVDESDSNKQGKTDKTSGTEKDETRDNPKKSSPLGERKKSTKGAKRSKEFMQSKSKTPTSLHNATVTDSSSKRSMVPSIAEDEGRSAVALSSGGIKEIPPPAPSEERLEELSPVRCNNNVQCHGDVEVTSL